MPVVDSYSCIEVDTIQAQQVVEETYLYTGIENTTGSYLYVGVEGIERSMD